MEWDIPKNSNLRVEACEQLREAFSGDLTRFKHVAVLLHANAIDGRCEARMGAFKARWDANEYAGYLRDKYVKIGIPFAVYIDGELFHDGGFYEWMEECR